MPTPAQNIASAAAAYANAAKGRFAAPAPMDGGGDDGFAALVKGAIAQAKKIGQRGEMMSIAAINDRADLTEVTTAVAEAELTLQTVVAVRDKVIEAYKEIIRMPI